MSIRFCSNESPVTRRTPMNREQFKGQWKQFRENSRNRGHFTDDDLMEIEGDYDKSTGSLQERYGEQKKEGKAGWNTRCRGLRDMKEIKANRLLNCHRLASAFTGSIVVSSDRKRAREEQNIEHTPAPVTSKK